MNLVETRDDGFERRVYQHNNPKAIFVVAHGAGAGLDHYFMDSICRNLAMLGNIVWSFNFPYMTIAKELNKKRPPNRLPILLEHFEHEVLLAHQANENNLPIYLCGKSMGGRVASLLLQNENVKSLVKAAFVWGYPFIPPGKPDKYEQRVAHFTELELPLYILQGERDTFGNLAFLSEKAFFNTVSNIQMPLETSIFGTNPFLTWITSGDHSFKPLKSSGVTQEQNIQMSATLTNQLALRHK